MIDSVLQKIRTNLLRVTYLDYRSLSFFRVLLGFVGLYRFTLALRWSEEFLAPDGFLPIVTLNVWATRWSVYFLNHDIKLYVDSRDQDSNGVNLIVDYYIESFRTNSSNRK